VFPTGLDFARDTNRYRRAGGLFRRGVIYVNHCILSRPSMNHKMSGRMRTTCMRPDYAASLNAIHVAQR